MRKHGLRMVGLCVAAALSVMAIAAASAQAEKGAHWNINGTALNNNVLLPEPEAELENKDGSLLSKIVGTPIKILCTGVTFEEAVLKEEGASLGKIKFTGCEIYLTEGGVEKLSAACLPHTGAENDVILTKLLKDLIVLHEGKPLDLLAPEEGSTFVTIATSAECSVGSAIPVIGEFFFKDCKDEGTVEQEVHLTEEGPLTALWVISKTAEHVSTIDGSANVFLKGAHKGLKWSGIPA